MINNNEKSKVIKKLGILTKNVVVLFIDLELCKKTCILSLFYVNIDLIYKKKTFGNLSCKEEDIFARWTSER